MKIEISHDLLAKAIYDKVDSENKDLIKVSKFIKTKLSFSKKSGSFLSKHDLDYIDPYLSKIELKPVEVLFLKKSRHKLVLKNYASILLMIIVSFVCGYALSQVENQETINIDKSALIISKSLK